MIQLKKGNEPTVLLQNSNKWTKVLEAHDFARTQPTESEMTRYNHKDIKTALIAETSGKCAYCESKFSHIAYGDVEHIVPKKNGYKLRFKWENLTIACDRCNTNKGSKDTIIDPYNINPEIMFRISGPMILPRPEFPEAVITERELKLNRAPLVERRAERIRRIHDLVVLAIQNRDENVKKAIIEDVKANEILPQEEFAAVSRAYIAGLVSDGTI